MHQLLYSISLMVQAWNQACPEFEVQVEWAEEYTLADAALKWCFVSMTATRAEALYIEERRQEFRNRLQQAPLLLRDLTSLVDALP